MENLIVDILGWVGSLMLITAYWSVSKKRIEPDSYIYHSFNIVGSLLLIVNSFYYGAFPSTAVNVVWVFIGLFYIKKSKRNV
jgi:hypothetical protein